MNITDFINLDRYPLHKAGSADWLALVESCKAKLAQDGLFDFPDFINVEAINRTLSDIGELMKTDTFTHQRSHNIYFKNTVDGLPEDHPALRKFLTTNHTLCADQIPESLLLKIYEWPELAQFLAAVMGKEQVYTMDDPIACMNVLAYREGEALNWHFDRSEFTTTLLIQSAQEGGVFEYCQDLRSDQEPNYDGVAQLIDGKQATTLLPQTAGTLNVFKGKNTAHRVTPVVGNDERIVAVLSYYDEPGVAFSAEEKIGFYGREA